MPHRNVPLAAAMLLSAAALPAPGAETWTLTNPTDVDYVDEPVRLGLPVPAGTERGSLVVRAGGREVGRQIEAIDRRDWIWVSATIPPGRTIEYAVDRGAPSPFPPRVKLVRDGDAFVLDNGAFAAKAPAGPAAGGVPPGPVTAVRLADGAWVGRSSWKSHRPLAGFTAEAIGDGTVFAKVRLRYAFDGKAGPGGDTPAFAQIDVSLAPGQRHVTIEESHEMARGDYWEFECTAGWSARGATCEIFGGAAGKPKNPSNWPRDLKPLGWSREALDRRYAESDPRLGDTLMWLVPRWNQHYQDGWMFAATDGRHAVGAIPARAGRWVWPHDNKIEVKARDSADYAGLRCPTWKGRRTWFLFAGPHDRFASIRGEAPPKRPGDRPQETRDIRSAAYALRYAFRPLDKIVHEFITDWPGRPDAAGGQPAYPASLNPMHVGRGWLGGSHGSASAATPLQRLVLTQIKLDWDFYGAYWTFWSPENPNFYTSLMRGPLAAAAEFKDHPRFAELARRVEDRFFEDVYHSVTLPGGAAQECPGYYSIHAFTSMARQFKDAYGFDATAWPQIREGQQFLYRISQPRRGGERLCHPGGDTHPGPNGPRPVPPFAGADVKAWKTEEFPGFGVIFRNRPGTDRETYLAFKAGPNRGHFHGDSLAFHWCANAAPVAVDHFCSYKPRAGQEHMHNRVAFAAPDLPYANMDGYERLIAFQAGPAADAAIGQVESPRLRFVTPLPPEDWDREHPQRPLDPPLRYRRAVVLMKGEPQDYFVLRDQHDGAGLKAIYCLHVYGARCDREGGTVDFEGMRLFVAEPDAFEYSRYDWKHDNGGGESTVGVRLAVSGPRNQFVTVLYPRAAGGAAMPAMEPIPGGVRVGQDEITFGGGIDQTPDAAYVTVRRAGSVVLALTGKDIDLDRPQGQIGLFVPDAGYPFGPIPDWLIRQRIGKVEPPR